jgi:hypothetical protein
VCVAALAILDRLDVVDVETLGWWLAERQLPSGGFNGRPEKLEDVSVGSFRVFFILSRMGCRVILSSAEGVVTPFCVCANGCGSPPLFDAHYVGGDDRRQGVDV